MIRENARLRQMAAKLNQEKEALLSELRLRLAEANATQQAETEPEPSTSSTKGSKKARKTPLKKQN